MDVGKVFWIINPIVKTLLRSPFHGIVSKNMMLVEFVGRKSGRTMVTPVSYHTVEGKLHFFTYEAGLWWKNFANGEEFVVLLRGRRVKCVAKIQRDGHASEMEAFMRAVPREAKISEVRVDKSGEFHPQDLAAAVDRTVFVEVEPC